MTKTNSIFGTMRRARGFSLAELVIALGVMAVGLVMVATLFPMAIKVHNNAVRTVLGSIICENGIATAKARFSVYGSPPSGETLEPVADDRTNTINSSTIFFPDTDRYYPASDDASPYGYAVAARRINDDGDTRTFEGYQVAVTSYQRWKSELDDESEVFWCELNNNVTFDPEAASVNYYAKGGKMQKGSPLINGRNGEFSTILSVKTSPTSQTTVLRMGLDLGSEFTPNILALSEEYRKTGDSEMTLTAFSPAMATMISRFGLVNRTVEEEESVD